MMKFALPFASWAIVESLRVESQVSPIRKVVNLLEKSAKALVEEGKKEEEEYEKYKCWCKKGTEELQKEIEAASRQAEESTAKAAAESAMVETLKQEIQQHIDERAQAQKDLEAAQAQRTKEHDAFVEMNADQLATIEALEGAIAALGGGEVAAFLQNAQPGVGMALQTAMENAIDISASEKDMAISLLMGQTSTEDVGASGVGEVTGMLKQMLDTEKAGLKEELAAEEASKKSFQELMAAKQDEIKASTRSIESKQGRLAEVSVSAVEAQNLADNSGESSARDSEMLAQMQAGCEAKDVEYEERSKMRQEESVAIAETIKILDNDEAHATFSTGGLHTAGTEESFLQKGKSHKSRANKALKAISKAKPTAKVGEDSLSLISSMIKVESGAKTGADFTKVIKMIDDMVVLLDKEQKTDTATRDQCVDELHNADMSKKDAENNKAKIEASLEQLETEITQEKEEVEAATQEIADLDSSVAEATEQRQSSNAEAMQEIQEQQAMISILHKAIERLNAFYNKKSEEPAEEAPSFLQLSTKLSEKVAPPPATTSGAYKPQDSNGPIGMLQKFTHDAELLITELQTTEQNEQAAYEKLMESSKGARAAAEQTKTDLEAHVAEAEGALADAKAQHSAVLSELSAVIDLQANLHKKCDFLMENYDLRMEMRDAEIESLKNGKAALQGAK